MPDREQWSVARGAHRRSPDGTTARDSNNEPHLKALSCRVGVQFFFSTSRPLVILAQLVRSGGLPLEARG